MDKTRLTVFLLCLILGGSVVMLGTLELRREMYSKHSRSDATQLVKDLHGEVNAREEISARAQMRRSDASSSDPNKQSWIDSLSNWIIP